MLFSVDQNWRNNWERSEADDLRSYRCTAKRVGKRREKKKEARGLREKRNPELVEKS